MAANPASKVVQTIQGLKAEVEKMSDEIHVHAAAQSARTKDGFHKIKTAVLDPWEQANAELEDFVNQLTNGGPPLDE